MEEQHKRFFQHQLQKQADDLKLSRELVYDIDALKEMGNDEIYRIFVVPALTRHAVENSEMRTALLSKGGSDWAEIRGREFAAGERKQTSQCSKIEQEIRAIETTMILKLAYPSDTNAGINAICEREPRLASMTVPPLKNFIRQADTKNEASNT